MSSSEARAGARQASVQRTSMRHSILLVDNDERVLRNLRLLLGWSGEWEIVGAVTDGQSALDIAASHRPQMVLLDLWLSDGCNGLDLLPQLRALEPPPLVVMLTAEPDPTVRDLALRLGAERFIDKLQPPRDLLHDLRALLTQTA